MNSFHHMKKILIIIILFAPLLASAAKIYKWVDENGVVHYGSSIPPKYQKQAREELDEKGITRAHIERAKTQEELEAELERKRAEEQARKEAEAEAERLKQERARLNVMYASEEEVLMQKEQRLKGIRESIDISEETLATQNRHLQSLTERAANYERSGSATPKFLLDDIKSVQEQIALQNEFIVQKRKEILETEAEFTETLRRYRFHFGSKEQQDKPES